MNLRQLVLKITCLLCFTACQVQDDLVSLSDELIFVQIGEEGNPFAAALSADLPVMFVRLDQNGGQFPSGYYGTGAQLLPSIVSKGDGKVGFTPKQFYNPDGSLTRFVGWYPTDGDWDAAQRTVSFPALNGATDILATAAIDGGLSSRFSQTPFNFKHLLTKVTLYAYISDPAFVNAWGKLVSVELIDKKQTCTLTLPATGDPAGTATTVAFGTPTGDISFWSTSAAGGLLDLTSMDVWVDDGSPHIAEGQGYAIFAPHTSSSDILTLKVTTESSSELIHVPYTDLELRPGHAYNLKICFGPTGVSFSAAIDDWNKGEDITADLEMEEEPTANCFIVAPGESITFPLVNAVRHGGASVSTTFTASKLWDDTAGGAVASVGTPDGKGSNAKLTITAGAAPGNAVVAVIDEQGIIRWSYHIWVVSGLTVIDGWLDRNLGAISAGRPTSATDTSSCGLLYQWGRKDPFRGSVNLDSPTEPDDYVLQTSSTLRTVAESIQNPTVYFTSINMLDGAWNSNKKTIYDPCPDGYVVIPTSYSDITYWNRTVTSWSIARNITAPNYVPLYGYRNENGDLVKKEMDMLVHTSIKTFAIVWNETNLFHAYSTNGVFRRWAGNVRCRTITN